MVNYLTWKWEWEWEFGVRARIIHVSYEKKSTYREKRSKEKKLSK